ncbi:hypothetical protein [Pedobacter caeni]|uniref:hypothetical protein n=1 Tax=Pedobacter caeni TaxID=288992 RepID=UPI0009352585|nr:hypothetical protein [Pedobacter caeni]
MKKNHIDIPITQLLGCTDDALQSIFGGVVSEIRDQLRIRIKNGELWSGAFGCQGFCPFKGCPGHEIPD